MKISVKNQEVERILNLAHGLEQLEPNWNLAHLKLANDTAMMWIQLSHILDEFLWVAGSSKIVVPVSSLRVPPWISKSSPKWTGHLQRLLRPRFFKGKVMGRKGPTYRAVQRNWPLFEKRYLSSSFWDSFLFIYLFILFHCLVCSYSRPDGKKDYIC